MKEFEDKISGLKSTADSQEKSIKLLEDNDNKNQTLIENLKAQMQAKDAELAGLKRQLEEEKSRETQFVTPKLPCVSPEKQAACLDKTSSIPHNKTPRTPIGENNSKVKLTFYGLKSSEISILRHFELLLFAHLNQ